MTDYTDLADGIDQMREAVAAAVAGLVADGFTDREARQIIAGSIASVSNRCPRCRKEQD